MIERRACIECGRAIWPEDNTGHTHGCPLGDNPGHHVDAPPCRECGWHHGRHENNCHTHQEDTARRRALRGY